LKTLAWTNTLAYFSKARVTENESIIQCHLHWRSFLQKASDSNIDVYEMYLSWILERQDSFSWPWLAEESEINKLYNKDALGHSLEQYEFVMCRKLKHFVA
jgi:hypothetical protein